MVVPLGGGAGNLEPMIDSEVPQEIKDSHYIWWWILMICWFVVALGRCVALDLLGAVVAGLMAYFVHFMVRNECEKMSQYCIFLFGFMCCMNAFLESINLLSALSGRVKQTALVTDQGAGSHSWKTTYTVTVEKHPFFDQRQGLVYNAQSVMMISSVTCNLLAVALSRFSYYAYPTSLFDDQDESFPVVPAPPGYGGVGQPPPIQRFGGGGQRLDGGNTANRGSNPGGVFEGAGQRLG